jgi:hypothetical protein
MIKKELELELDQYKKVVTYDNLVISELIMAITLLIKDLQGDESKKANYIVKEMLKKKNAIKNEYLTDTGKFSLEAMMKATEIMNVAKENIINN